MAEERKKRIHRPAPCPACDIEAMESWLAYMAAEGWLLEKDGFFAGFAAFEQAEAQKIRYRLEVTHREITFWSDEQEPPEEALELSSAGGWEYVARREGFFIYRSADPNAAELNTDPEIQALALKKLRRRSWNYILSLAFWMVILPALRLKVGLLQIAVAVGTPLILFAVFLLVWCWAVHFKDLIYLHRLRKKLLNTGEIDHQKAWQPQALRYRIGRFLRPALIGLCCLLFFGLFMADVGGAKETPLQEYKGQVPFATMADFDPAGEYSLNDWGFSNTVSTGKDWLASRFIHWQEIADVGNYSGGLYVDYYETAAPWIARGLAEEFHSMDRKNAGTDYDELLLPELDADYAAGYMNNLHFATVILQRGDKILHASFYQTSKEQLSVEEWVRLMADCLE